MPQPRLTIYPEDLFGSMTSLEAMRELAVCEEYSSTIPAKLGAGSISLMRLREGSYIGVGNYQVGVPVELEVDPQDFPLWTISFNMLSSEAMPEGGDENWRCQYAPMGQGSLFYKPVWEMASKMPVNKRISMVSLFMEPAEMQELVAASNKIIPEAMHPLLKTSPYQCDLQLTPEIYTIMSQVLYCPYQDLLRRLFFEAKAMEFLTHVFAQLCTPHSAWLGANSLSETRIKQVYEAKEIIAENLQNPPKLLDLAHQVGMSHIRLNECFREVFGCTVFEHLRELRLARAKALLDKGTLNVAEVANEVGYSNCSNFAKLFKEAHAVPPGTYLRMRRRAAN